MQDSLDWPISRLDVFKDRNRTNKLIDNSHKKKKIIT